MKIIVNGDDFGRSYSSNLAICEAMDRSLCTQSTLMVNLPDSDAAVGLAKNYGFCEKVGLHINLTLGEPMTADIRKIRLYCRDGRFVSRGYNSYKRQVFPMYVSAIRQELEAQINKFLNYGFTLMHIDSHNWVHLSIPVWMALKPLLAKYGFRSVRGIRPGLLSEGSFLRNTYYTFFKALFMRSRGVYISPYASNVEQFVESEKDILSKGFPCVEVFTHPEMIEGRLMDNSYSYKREPIRPLEDNIALISDYEKTDYGSVCSSPAP